MQEERTIGTVPIHHQIADDLRARIAAGELQPGDELPTTAALAETWGCSDLTARKGVEVLREEGRITGGRGRPPRVKEPTQRQKIALSDGWTQVQKDLVLRPEAERKARGAIELTSGISIDDTISTQQYTETTAGEAVADHLDVEQGTTVIERLYEMRHKQTGVRLSWSTSWIPKHLIEGNPDLLDDSNEPWPGGHQHQLWTVGIEIERFERRLYAVQPTPGERQLWGMEAGTPMITVVSRSIDTEGRIVEASEARYPADRTEITISEQLRVWTAEEKASAADVDGDA